ncbi:MAG: glutaredoxin family protein [Smithellaceae bacterium]
MIKHLLLFMSLLLFFCTTAQADFYKWEDENGIVHITDYPPPAKYGKKVQVHKYDSSVQEEEATSKDGQKKEPDAVLYTKNSCDDCDKAREFLKAKKILFTEYNTDTSKEAAKKRKAIDDSDDAPFAIINGNQVYGFSESVYNKVLKVKP